MYMAEETTIKLTFLITEEGQRESRDVIIYAGLDTPFMNAVRQATAGFAGRDRTIQSLDGRIVAQGIMQLTVADIIRKHGPQFIIIVHALLDKAPTADIRKSKKSKKVGGRAARRRSSEPAPSVARSPEPRNEGEVHDRMDDMSASISGYGSGELLESEEEMALDEECEDQPEEDAPIDELLPVEEEEMAIPAEEKKMEFFSAETSSAKADEPLLDGLVGAGPPASRPSVAPPPPAPGSAAPRPSSPKPPSSPPMSAPRGPPPATAAAFHLSKKKESSKQTPKTQPQVTRHASVEYYKVMNPFHVHDVLVDIAPKPVKKTAAKGATRVKGQVTVKAETRTEVKPLFPGCIVVPASMLIDLNVPYMRSLKFSVTPLVRGNINASIDFFTDGERVSRIPLTDITIRDKRMAQLLGATGVVGTFANKGLKMSGADVSDFNKAFRWYSIFDLEPLTLVGLTLAIAMFAFAGVALRWARKRKERNEHGMVDES